MIELAYPRDRAERLRAERCAVDAPPARTTYAFSYGVLRQLPPGNVEVDWEELEDESALIDVLGLVVTPGEYQGLEDIRITLQEWLDRARPDSCATDLAFILDLVSRSPHAAHLYDSLDLPIRYEGPALGAVRLPERRIHYRKEPVEKERFSLAPIIRRPIRTARGGGRRLVQVALQALCPRDLEIYPLIYANRGDVVSASCGRGIRVALVGVVPERRSQLESLYFFLVLKNGVPVAYGPAAVFCGCCEMGINLFPDFRGREIRYIYAQVMRVLRHVLSVEYYFLTSYGMGEANPDAIASGAFWFYRKLGFSASNLDVEALAREEEERMRVDPGHRSDRRTLRRLSRTAAYFDLSGGRCRPFDFGALGIAQTRFLGGDRDRAERRCDARIRRLLGTSYRPLAPLLAMIEDLPRWSRREKASLARILVAKGARSEVSAARLFGRHERLQAALRALAE